MNDNDINIANKRELARIFGCTTKTIDEWVKKGMPIKSSGKKGIENEYNTAECINWRIQDKTALCNPCSQLPLHLPI